MSPPRGVTSPLCCCIAGCSAGCKPGTPFPGGKGKLLLFFGVLFSFLICSLQEATAEGCAGNAASHPSTASLLFIFFIIARIY